jgi:hypothetical protein
MHWIRRHWVALLSAIPLIPTVFKWLGWIVSRGGDMDFVISRTNDPGWVGTMIGWIINPPGWAILPLIAGGLFLIWLDVRRRSDVQVKDQITTPQTAGTPYGTRPEKATTPNGEKLVELGQTVLIVAGVICIVAMVFGLFLILIGDWQTKRAAMRAPAKSEIAQSAPPSVKAPVPDQIVVPAAPPPSPPTPATPAPPAREFVKENVTPEYLVGLYDGNNTALGANLRASVFTGKWMQVTGSLEAMVGGAPNSDGSRSAAIGTLTSTNRTSFFLIFRGAWVERAAMVPKNQTVTVHGKIQEIARARITLEDVELIEPMNEGPTRSPRARRGAAERKRRKKPPRLILFVRFRSVSSAQ